MAWRFLVNQRTASNAMQMYLILQNFCTAGWTLQASADGVTAGVNYGAFPGAFTASNPGGTGAGALGNNYAWFRIQDPSGNREFVVERSTSTYLWAIAYSPAAHFTTGGTNVAAPTASDGVPVFGDIHSSTGSGGTYATFFTSDEGKSILHMGMNDSASVQYMFYVYTQYLGGGTSSMLSAWFMDYVTGVDTGDLDPTVHYAQYNTSNLYYAYTTGTAKCFWSPSLVYANWAGVTLGQWYSSSIGGGVGWNPWGDINPYNPWASATKGWKGWSSLLRTAPHLNNTFNPGDVVSVGNPPTTSLKNYVATYYSVFLPWPAGTDPVT